MTCPDTKLVHQHSEFPSRSRSFVPVSCSFMENIWPCNSLARFFQLRLVARGIQDCRSSPKHSALFSLHVVDSRYYPKKHSLASRRRIISLSAQRLYLIIIRCHSGLDDWHNAKNTQDNVEFCMKTETRPVAAHNLQPRHLHLFHFLIGTRRNADFS